MTLQGSPAALPSPLAAERGEVLAKTLRGLPTELLAPLLRGLRRHADSLCPGHLGSTEGGCAVGMMLHELAADPDIVERFRPPRRLQGRFARLRNHSVEDAWPEIAAAYPRLHHVEIVFDVTCDLVRESGAMPVEAVPRSVGLWMAAATQAEINMRHLAEAGAAGGPPARTANLDPALFADTVARLEVLRPELSHTQATRIVESLVGARRADAEPLFVPGTWEREVELQRERVGQAAG